MINASLLVLILYVGAVITTKLLHVISPECFGDLGGSLSTRFQRGGVPRSVLEGLDRCAHPDGFPSK